MALSDYLTSDEWDGCFYCFAGQQGNDRKDLGASMRATIAVLLAKGYKFQGLDEHGNKYAHVTGTNNADKLITAMFGGNVDFRKVLVIGRNFIKAHAPSLLTETDEEWEAIINKQN